MPRRQEGGQIAVVAESSTELQAGSVHEDGEVVSTGVSLEKSPVSSYTHRQDEESSLRNYLSLTPT